jgi:aerobic carbon-monoxide dehydrogenase medium subunit
MKISDFTLPSCVEEAQACMKSAGDSAFFLAGGTSIRFLKETAEEKVAIDVSKLPFVGIVNEDSAYEIGSLTRINDLMKYKGEGWVLDRVAKLVATQQIRNMSTVGGNIARIFYWSDFPVALMALDAEISIKGNEWFTVDADTYFDKQPIQKLINGNIIGFIEIPEITKGKGFAYHKETRTYSAFSTLNVAVYVSSDDDGVIENVRIVIGACTPFPVRLKNVETQLIGKKISELNFDKLSLTEVEKMSIVPKEGMTKIYCRHLVKTKVKDVLLQAVAEAKGDCHE